MCKQLYISQPGQTHTEHFDFLNYVPDADAASMDQHVPSPPKRLSHCAFEHCGVLAIVLKAIDEYRMHKSMILMVCKP